MSDFLGIHSIGKYLPKKTITIQDLSEEFDVEIETLHDKLGFKKKHVAIGGEEHPSQMAAAAANKALELANVAPDKIGFVLSVGVSRDYRGGFSLAQEVACLTGVENAMAADLTSGCVGSIYAMKMAPNYVAGKPFGLIVAAERWHETIQVHDRLPLGVLAHGDGAAAAVLGPGAGNHFGFFGITSNPELNGFIYIPGGGTVFPSSVYDDPSLFCRQRRFDCDISKVYQQGYISLYNNSAKQLNLAKSDVDYLLVNQGRTPFRAGIQKAVNPNAICPETYSECGHVGAADVFLTLEKLVQSKAQVSRGLLMASNVASYGLVEHIVEEMTIAVE
ncbi:MAG: hypothetical protein HRT45_19470 [Bdellovibrionales bacterium]|nr:hypothetical protein [Bdellovibrionales bacterium]